MPSVAARDRQASGLPARRRARNAPAARTDTPAAQVLQLQRTVGNAAVARLAAGRVGKRVLARANGHDDPLIAPAKMFQNPELEAAYDLYEPIGALTLKQRVGLYLLDHRRTGPWANLRWDTVAAEAGWRICNPDLIDQRTLGLCPSAAALHAKSEKSAPEFAGLVIEIFSDGKANGKKINKKLLANSPLKGMASVDWMVLSAMQDVTNTVLGYTGTAGGLAEGASFIGTKEMLENFADCVKTEYYGLQYLGGEKKRTQKVSSLLTTHGKNVVVVMEVTGELINDQYAKATDRLMMLGDLKGSNHWVRLMEPVDWRDTEVTAKIYTWGRQQTVKMTPKNFARFVGGYVVGARKANIKL